MLVKQAVATRHIRLGATTRILVLAAHPGHPIAAPTLRWWERVPFAQATTPLCARPLGGERFPNGDLELEVQEVWITCIPLYMVELKKDDSYASKFVARQAP